MCECVLRTFACVWELGGKIGVGGSEFGSEILLIEDYGLRQIAKYLFSV